MITRIPPLLLFVCLTCHPASGAEPPAYNPPPAAEVLRSLKPEHPRLLLTAARVEEIKRFIATDEVAEKVYQSILTNAGKALKQKPSVYELRDGRRLLYVSSEVLGRVEALAFCYRMTEDSRYLDRAWAELAAVAAFKDWHPDHFLDTAVMTQAVAIGSDWLWDQWAPEQRQTLRRAIVELGLKPALKVYESKKGWHMNSNNWNQVCNGGIGAGALAVADEEPELASRILAAGLASLPRAMRLYAPDGGGEEGVGYWSFGSRYNVFLMAALEQSLGTDFGLGAIDGFRQSGDYQIYLSGARRLCFDFSDCPLSSMSTPQHFWMARKYDLPRYAWFRYAALRDGQGGEVMDLIFFDPIAKNFDFKSMPPDRLFRHAEVATMRDSWSEGEGFIAALQGGANRGSHRHLDLGSFILEADGVRWIIDSGKESETYQNHVNHTDRWDFYRTRAEGHNTLVFNPGPGLDQSLDGRTAFRDFKSLPDQASTSLDLSSAYTKVASRVIRSFTLQRGQDFTVTDEITCAQPSEVWSYFHTEANIELAVDQHSALLTKNGKSLTVTLTSPPNAVFAVLPAQPGPDSPHPPKQASNKGRQKLAIHLSGVESVRTEVRFSRPAAAPGTKK